jgi:hypothetical protein
VPAVAAAVQKHRCHGPTDQAEPAKSPQQTISNRNKGLQQALSLADGSNHE